MSAGLVPLAPLPGAPDLWPEMTLYAATVLLEAEAEPDLGKLAVAWVIRNRMDQEKRSPRFVILGKDGIARGYEAFSCWNDDYLIQRTQRLSGPNPMVWEACWRAASIAYWKLADDPTHGSTFYLNPELTRSLRPDRTLPTWYDVRRVKLRVGRHEFLIAA